MDAVEIRLDAGLFSGDVVVRATHRYSGDFFIELISEPAGHLVRLSPKESSTNTERLAERFRNDALDECLRARVRAETSELQAVLVQAALREAKPHTRGSKL
jgi:His-Xaa-Ser system protein HxsD